MSPARRSAPAVVFLALCLPASFWPAPGRAADEGHAVRLPEGAVQMCSGGCGRLLIFHLKRTRQLAVVDVAQARIVHAFELPSDDLCFAANADSLFVAFTTQKLLLRYSLATFKRDKTIPLEHPPTHLSMGSCSTGPLMMIFDGGPTAFLDAQTLRPYDLHVPIHGADVRVSADGQTFVTFTAGQSPLQYNVLRLDGRRLTNSEGWGEGYNGAWLAPTADGDMIFRNGATITTGDLKPVSADTLRGSVLLATESPAFFLSFRPGDPKDTAAEPQFQPNSRYAANHQSSQVAICSAADCRALYTVRGLEPMGGGIRSGYFQAEPRIRYLPKEQLIVTVPESNDGVVVRQFDLAAALKKSHAPFLFVVSKPLGRAEIDKDYRYSMEVLSGSGGVKYALESGPEGMTISTEGEVHWKVPADAAGTNRPVVVSLADAGGKEAFHSFTIAVAPAAAPLPAVATAPAVPAGPNPFPHDPRPRPSPPAQPGAAAVAEVAKAGADRLQLPAADCAWTPGLGYRNMLVLHGDRLVVLAPDGITIEKRIKLPKTYSQIAERADCYVALAVDPKAVEVIDKKTFAVRKSLKLTCTEFSDLAIHPRLPVSYVAMKDLGKTPACHFIVFNEKTGDGREPEDCVGAWLKPDPKGRFLIVGYRDIYRSGSRLLVNPGQFDIVPEYGDISWLIRYSLDREGMPRVNEIKEKAGGNGQGLRLSKDGQRVTYLSHVGYPQFSGNLAGWDPKDLEKIPVTYAVKGKGTTYDLAYHPVLPLVASPGSGSAIFFHRETGDQEQDRLQLPAAGLGGEPQSVQFSPDGKGLVFRVVAGGVYYLQRAALRLNPAELRTLEAEWKKHLAGDKQEKVPEEKVALKSLDALKGGPRQALSSKELGLQFTDSVVVIRGEDSAATGFVVGSGGYILTCAHCLVEGKMTVSYRDAKGGAEKTHAVEPRVVASDDGRDLALLKIDVPHPLPPVQLAGGEKIDAGDRVTVIGNPGLGSTILDYTMTDGIVSSPRRELEGRSFIQVSAQVNPGSSGAPMFNSTGQVIGVVVLKGHIEGAGFAIPAEEVTGCLLRWARISGDDGKLLRTWTDSSGKRRLEAAYCGYDAGVVKLENRSGRQVSMPLDKLSESDQKLVRAIAAETQRDEAKK